MAVTTRSLKKKNGGASRRPPPAKKTQKGAAKAHNEGSNAGKSLPPILSQTKKVVVAARKAQCIGGLVPRNIFKHYKFEEMVLKLLSNHPLPKGGDTQLWIFTVTEALDESTYKDLIKENGTEAVPIHVIVYSKVCPTTTGAIFSLQCQEKGFFPLAEKSLVWKEISPRVNILTSFSAGIFGHSYDYTHLALTRPSIVSAKLPDEVTEVNIDYKGKTIGASTKSDVDAYIEDDVLEPDDRESVIAALKEEKAKQKQANAVLLETEKQMFSEMVDALAESNSMDRATAKQSLEDMKIYKVYPSNLPQPTAAIGIGGFAWPTTGFRKTLMLNRFIGDADGYY